MALNTSELSADEQACSVAVEQLMRRYKWNLLQREDFIQRAYAHLSAGVAQDARRAAVYTYSQALYTACSGAEGAQRQEEGYTELYYYLCSSTRSYYADESEDATQRALLSTFTTFSRCRNPGAFFAFALQHFMDAVRAMRRDQKPLAGYINPQLPLPEVAPYNPEMESMARERRSRLSHFASEFLRKHPRSQQQFAALWLKYMVGLDDVTIGQKLGKSVSSVHVLRARAVEKLRADPQWRAFAAEYGIISREA